MLFDRMRKGMSPLIAAVILIAATMSIAGILSFWVTGFVRKKLTESENVTEETGCMGADFKLHLARYDSTNRRLYLVVDNTRAIDLKLQTLYLFYPDRMVSKPLNITLKGNEMKQFYVDGVDPDFQDAKIKTNCPEVSLDFTFSQVIR